MTVKLYTWYDVEVALLEARDRWPAPWLGIEVTADEVAIAVSHELSSAEAEEFWVFLEGVFGPRVDRLKGLLLLEGLPEQVRSMIITTYVIEGGERGQRVGGPLFGVRATQLESPLPVPTGAPPIFAFYSFKGGVGRTLSLLAFAQAWSELRPGGRLLLVDGDWEAPGLTWLAQHEGSFRDFSQLDALALIHSVEDWQAEALPVIKAKVQEERLRIPVGSRVAEHYFLPAFRYERQILDLPVRPDQMLQMTNRRYIISDFLFELGRQLQVDAVLVDLRAGVSELAAPLILDPRVQPLLVTSTSEQSVAGTVLVLRQLCSRHRMLGGDVKEPLVMLSMVPHDLDRDKVSEIRERLQEAYCRSEDESDSSADWLNDGLAVRELPFDQELVHLEGFEDIDRKLAGTEVARQMTGILQDLLPEKEDRRSESAGVDRSELLARLRDGCRERLYAEQGHRSDLFPTVPLRALAQKTQFVSPAVVVVGAKGSGKTFTFLQLLHRETWEGFVEELLGEPVRTANSRWIFPLVAPRGLRRQVPEVLQHATQRTLAELHASGSFDQRTVPDAIEKAKLHPHAESELFWRRFWARQMAQALGLDAEEAGALEAVNQYLQRANRYVVFVVDGLEDYFQRVHSNPVEQVAVRALCQGIMEHLQAMPQRRVGVVVFVRRDIVEASIQQNFGQFFSLYEPFELRWGLVEALRLFLWMSVQLGVPLETTPAEVPAMSLESVKAKLALLWGRKMGPESAREAYTHRWVLAALSNFEGQLQARDVVRFLRDAADLSLSIETREQGFRSDRYLQVPAIKRAVEVGGTEKVREIEEEIQALQGVFDKIRNAPFDSRYVPLQPAELNLTPDEVRLLKAYHLAKEVVSEKEGEVGGLYMPEIVRQGLELRPDRRARPPVLKLMQRILAHI